MWRLGWRRLRQRRFRQEAGELDVDLGARVRRLLALLLLLVTVHSAAMMLFEDLSPREAIWLTMTTLATVGYGDYSAHSAAGQTATIVLLYLVGITVLAQLASDFIDHRLQRRQLKLRGSWEWRMRDHLLVINPPRHSGQHYLQRLIAQLRDTPAHHDTPVLLLTENYPDGLPEALRQQGVVHHHGYPDSDTILSTVAPERALAIVVLAEDAQRASDAITFDILHRLSERIDMTRVPVIAECVDDANRSRLLRLGIRSVIRPVRAYPELVVRALVAPGVERVLENLFTHDDDHSLRYDLPLRGLAWGEVVSRLIRQDFGTALAYVTESGDVVCNPPANEPASGIALIIMVRAGSEPSTDDLARVLAG
ncbi:MAG: potassium channel family protein [Nitrococcus sp.]|nr:potassium channel family protein [Nitrococcus sp.]